MSESRNDRARWSPRQAGMLDRAFELLSERGALESCLKVRYERWRSFRKSALSVMRRWPSAGRFQRPKSGGAHDTGWGIRLCFRGALIDIYSRTRFCREPGGMASQAPLCLR